MNFTNYYKTLGLPDFSPIEKVTTSFEYSIKALLRLEGDDDPTPTEVLDRLNQANNVLSDPEIKDSYDVALQNHLTRIRQERNYYAILNIVEFASSDEIKDAHFYEVLRHQPPEHHAEALAYVTESHAMLTDAEKKEMYDAALRLKRTSL